MKQDFGVRQDLGSHNLDPTRQSSDKGRINRIYDIALNDGDR